MSRGQAEDGTVATRALLRHALAMACLLATPWALHPQESEKLDRCPDHPRLLEEQAALRIEQGRPAEAEILAGRLLRVLSASAAASAAGSDSGSDSGWDYGWELLAVSRYLQDDTRGALRAWNQGRTRTVRSVEVLLFSPAGPDRKGRGAAAAGLAGIPAGRPLTVEGLVRGERKLAAIPAASSARLAYRALPSGEASVEGTVVLRQMNPLGRLHPVDLAVHAARLVTGRVHLVSADPLGHLERWEFAGSLEGTLQAAALSLAHPAPRGTGVWRWSLEHDSGRHAFHDPSAGSDVIVRQERTGMAWSHSDWVTAILRGSVEGRLDLHSGRGTLAGAGMAWSLVPLDGRGRIELSGTGWTQVGGGPDAGGRFGTGERGPFGRVAIQATLPPDISSWAQAPSGFDLRLGILAVSARTPLDLVPRIGSGGHVDVLMRARSDIDGRGIVRPILPGSAWVHGGIEFLRPVGAFGPVALGIGVFADGARVLSRSASPAAEKARPASSLHLGLGLRARVPGVEGWLRTDWGIDPADGSSTISAAWVRAGLP